MHEVLRSVAFIDNDGDRLGVRALSGYDPDTGETAGEVYVDHLVMHRGIRLTSAAEVADYLASHDAKVREAAKAAGLLPEDA